MSNNEIIFTDFQLRMKNRAVHLKGLNGIRAIAALMVVFSHVVEGADKFNLNPFAFGKMNDDLPRGVINGQYGVSVFFCLSGFLITYLLLLEKELGKIYIGKFYLRRILRIWPLYYLYFSLSLVVIFILGLQFSFTSAFLYIFYAANFAFILKLTLPFLTHYWSLGVEEQFYSFWPWVVRSKLRLSYFIIASIVAFMLAKVFLKILLPDYDKSFIYKFLAYTRFHTMMIGALGALLYYQHNKVFLKLITSKVLQVLGWVILILAIAGYFHIASIIDNEIMSIAAMIVIMGQVTGRNRIFNLENKVLDFLGKISYGIYVFHPLVIFGLSSLIKDWNISPWLKYSIVFSLVIGSTILISYLSYEYFEKIFLKKKIKYTIVKSSPTRQSEADGIKEPILKPIEDVVK